LVLQRWVTWITSAAVVSSLENVEHLVVDEVERMLGMGFEPQIRNIIEHYSMPQPGLDEG